MHLHFTEKRNKTRIPVQVEVRYTAPESVERLACSRNISENSIMLSGMPDLKLGNGIKLTFSLPGYFGNKIEVLTKTIWNRISNRTGKMDIGLYFTEISRTSEELIKRFITVSKPETFPPIIHL